MAEKIKVIIKEPGKAPEIKTITNDLGTLQSIVGGYIETVTLASDFVIICNEDGKLWNLPYNFDFGGQSFVGTVVFAGGRWGQICRCAGKIGELYARWIS